MILGRRRRTDAGQPLEDVGHSEVVTQSHKQPMDTTGNDTAEKWHAAMA
jgi:hypothetical protein